MKNLAKPNIPALLTNFVMQCKRLRSGILSGFIAAMLLALAPTTRAALLWDAAGGGGGTGNWNDPSWWNGVTHQSWIPGADADFQGGTGGTITLSDGAGTSVGAVRVGTTGGGNLNFAFIGGALSAQSLTVQGNAGNWGNYSANLTLTTNVPALAVAGDLAVGRANLTITGGTLTANRIIAAAGSADWGRIVVAGGSLTATHGIDGSTSGCVTFAIDLNGGSLRTPSIRVADREVGASNNAWLTWNGGTVVVSASNPSFISLYGGNQNTYVGNGGAIIDTDGHDIGIGVNLLAKGSGGLTKRGGGTLTLSGANTYLGGTIVNQGTLAIARPFLSATAPLRIASGASLTLNFSGSNTVGELVLGGTAQAAGTYDATTHPGFLAGTGRLVVMPSAIHATWPDAGDGIASFRRMKYGFFVHYVWGGSAYTVTVNPDGSRPEGLNDLADRFDAAGFASDIASMGVEYVIFTAWHANMNCLWPSAKMDQWLSGHTARRDLLGDMITAVKAKGIHVLFYTHPRDGHDLDAADQAATGWNGTIDGYNPDWSVFDRPKWNDFINDIYADLIDRYGSRIDGLFIDEGSGAGDSWRVVDYPRLRQTIKSRQPDLLMMQNFYGTNYSCDIGATEISYWGSWVPGTDPNNWPATGRPMSMVMGGSWAAVQPEGNPATRYDAPAMFRLTVLRAGVNSTDGGGINWAAGPYPGGGWEDGVLAQMRQLGTWIAPIRRSICTTYPSPSWVTPPTATINGLTSGIVATRSAEDGSEFIHVLTPPAGNSLAIPSPADRRGYISARLLDSGNAVALVRNADGGLILTLQNTDTWNALDTVIELKPASVTWTGDGGEAGPDTAAWSESVDYFTGGSPVATCFRSGDGVNFSGNGASHAYLWQPNLAVGDLKFSRSDYHIHPNGPATLTLATGRIDVADGMTATFHETGIGGPLALAGNSGLTKTGGGTLILDLPAGYTGNTVLTNGALAIRDGGSGSGGNIVFNGGTLRYLTGAGAGIPERIRHGTSPVRIDTGGNNITYAMPLDPTNNGGLVKLGAGTLSLGGGLSSIGNPTVVADGTLKLDPGTGAAGAIPNPGFETPAYAAQGWSYNPSGTGWTFSPASGIASNKTPWVTTSPQGVQIAFIQNGGSIRGEIGVAANGYYHLNFTAANRPSYPPSGLVVEIDDITLATFPPGQIGSGGDFNTFTLPAIHLMAGTHTLTFQGLQNGSDSDTLIDDISLTGSPSGTLPASTQLQLTGGTAVFDPGSGPLTLDSLVGAAGSQVILTNTDLVIGGNDPAAVFAGSITGTGTVSNHGTLRLIGDATLAFKGTLTNVGLLDVMTWNGTLPAGFINHGIVLDRSNVRINSYIVTGVDFTLTITAYPGHNYQLQRTDTLRGPWVDMGAAQRGGGSALTFSDPGGGNFPGRFYRIAVTP